MNKQYPQYFIEHDEDPYFLWRLSSNGKADIASKSFASGWTESVLKINTKENIHGHNLKCVTEEEARSLFPLAFADK